jgi:hypothetical protein
MIKCGVKTADIKNKGIDLNYVLFKLLLPPCGK